MMRVTTCLWNANAKSHKFSTRYDETWVEKLYRGCHRNLTRPFQFVVFTDRPREFTVPVLQEPLQSQNPDYGCMIEPFRLGGPMVVMGLDTIILGNIDHLAAYCEQQGQIALPRDPYKPERSINAVALVPPGHTNIFADWGGQNDMEWLREFDWQPIDDLFPGHIASLKVAHPTLKENYKTMMQADPPKGARIVYFHGEPKPDRLMHLEWVREYWR